MLIFTGLLNLYRPLDSIDKSSSYFSTNNNAYLATWTFETPLLIRKLNLTKHFVVECLVPQSLIKLNLDAQLVWALDLDMVTSWTSSKLRLHHPPVLEEIP